MYALRATDLVRSARRSGFRATPQLDSLHKSGQLERILEIITALALSSFRRSAKRFETREDLMQMAIIRFLKDLEEGKYGDGEKIVGLVATAVRWELIGAAKKRLRRERKELLQFEDRRPEELNSSIDHSLTLKEIELTLARMIERGMITQRQVDVFIAMALGFSWNEVESELGISRGTIHSDQVKSQKAVGPQLL
ncbi:sigma-70 family RNA polymerase sigma factor [Candidatus Micrarchaeota archaeon]|nr:sigma-70 family RNA polymerase sigma factor [Candidatus Micrarchaeota archaeon]